MSRGNLDLSVYFVLDPSLCAERDVLDIARAALTGGVTMVQYRDKAFPSAFTLQTVKRLLELCRKFDVPLLVNDYVDIAQEAGVDGVHLGQGDMTPQKARRLLGEQFIIGQTAYTRDQIEAVDPDVVDYIGTGPFYETQTKKGKPVLGQNDGAAFRELVALSPVPVVGIGGITPVNAAAVMEAGAGGVAMMRAISQARDPAQAAQDFVRTIKLYR